MKFAVIGCGSIGMRHISNLLDMGHQVVAYNRGETRRCMAKQRYGILTYACLETMLDTNTIDAVIICTSNSVHSDNLTFVVEQGFDNHNAVQEPRDLQHDNRERRDQSVAQRVFDHDVRKAHAFQTRGADVLRGHDFGHRGAGHARDIAHAVK